MILDMKDAVWPGWETIGVLGQGSFGAVYEIRRNVFGETEKAALKVISIPQTKSELDEMYSEGYDDVSIQKSLEGQLKSIVSEYSLMRKLNGCSNVVHCDDLRYEPKPDGIGWNIYIKMELLTSFSKVLPQEISEQTVLKIGKDMCQALERCAMHNIVHRDIKPQNMFVSDAGDYKLGDFGIAKTIEKTTGGTKIGTFKYMAPEVYNNQPYGAAADIYSLGLVLYWLLNDRRMPFVPLPPAPVMAGIDGEAANRRLMGEPIPAPKNGSPELKRIVMKACAFDPADRYQSAEELHKALDSIGTHSAAPAVQPAENLDSEATVRVRKVHLAPDNAVQNAPAPQPVSVSPAVRKKPNAILIIGVVVLLLAIIGGILLIPHLSDILSDDSPKKSDQNQKNSSSLNANAKVGNILTFGSYEQDNNLSNGKEDIQWIVLDVQDGKALLISKNALAFQRYHNTCTNVTWETCSLRQWLNNDFIDSAFTADEKEKIPKVTVTAGANPGYSTSPGMNTLDQVFLLSITEANQYFSSDAGRQCTPTSYAAATGTNVNGGSCWWWLRSPGGSQSGAAGVQTDGSVHTNGNYVNVDMCAVRPVLWVELDD